MLCSMGHKELYNLLEITQLTNIHLEFAPGSGSRVYAFQPLYYSTLILSSNAGFALPAQIAEYSFCSASIDFDILDSVF